MQAFSRVAQVIAAVKQQFDGKTRFGNRGLSVSKTEAEISGSGIYQEASGADFPWIISQDAIDPG